jgi:hypothetical protein
LKNGWSKARNNLTEVTLGRVGGDGSDDCVGRTLLSAAFDVDFDVTRPRPSSVEDVEKRPVNPWIFEFLENYVRADTACWGGSR